MGTIKGGRGRPWLIVIGQQRFVYTGVSPLSKQHRVLFLHCPNALRGGFSIVQTSGPSRAGCQGWRSNGFPNAPDQSGGWILSGLAALKGIALGLGQKSDKTGFPQYGLGELPERLVPPDLNIRLVKKIKFVIR